MSSTTATERGIASAVVGAVLWADAVLARLLFQADETAVWFLGRKIAWVCSLRSQYGLPCPTCGITRSSVLALHGEWALAWQIAPVGPVAVAGVLALGAVLLLAGIADLRGARVLPRWRAPLQKAALIYGAAAFAIWIGGWAFSFSAALSRP